MPTFVHIASGQVEPSDVVVLSTQRLLRAVTPAQLAQMSQSDTDIMDQLIQALTTEHEEAAVLAYEAKTGLDTETVGFIMPTFTDAYGGSPDRLIKDIRDPGILEVKCPSPTVLIRYRHQNQLPIEYKTQIQGLLWITGYEWADFWAWHPELEPFHLTVERDETYIERLAEAMPRFLADVAAIAADNELQGIDGAEVIE